MFSHAELQAVLDTALDAVIVMHSDGSVIDWNGQAEAMFGWQRSEAMGAEMAKLIVPERYRDGHRHGLQRYLATGEGPVLRKRIEITGLRKGGEEFPIELSITPTSYKDQQVFLGSIRDISSRVRSEERQTLLLGELEHRTKNMLAIVMAMVSQTAKSTSSIDEFSKTYLARLTSLSRAYGLLTAKNWQEIALKSLLSEVVTPHLGLPGQLEFVGENIVLPANKALAVSMILHELTTNAVKYGALRSDGKITVTIEPETDGDSPAVRLVWEETGVIDVTAPKKAGFGTKLIESTACHELKGSVEATFSPERVRYNFQFPL